MGLVIRAGVDDQAMVRALGINISVVFAVTFFVGAFLAGMGGAMGASFAGVATGADGAVAAQLARRRDHRRTRLDQGRRRRLAAVRHGGRVLAGLPAQRLHLLLDHPHVRAARPGAGGASHTACSGGPNERCARVLSTANARARSSIVVVLLIVLPTFGSQFFVEFVLTRALILGLVAVDASSSCPRYGGMVSLAQLLHGRRRRLHDRQLRGRDRPQGPEARLNRGSRWSSRSSSPPSSRSCSVRCQPHDRHLLPHADAHVRGHRLLRLRSGDDDLRFRRHHRPRSAGLLRRPRCGCTTLALVLSVLAYLGFRAIAAPVRPRARRGPRRPGADGVARVPRRRCTARWRSPSPASSPASPACSTSGGTGRSTRTRSSIGATIDLLIIAVIGGIGHSRARGSARSCSSLPTTTCAICRSSTGSGSPTPGSTPSSACSCSLIVVLSPDGLMGIIERLRRRRGFAKPTEHSIEPATAATTCPTGQDVTHDRTIVTAHHRTCSNKRSDSRFANNRRRNHRMTRRSHRPR